MRTYQHLIPILGVTALLAGVTLPAHAQTATGPTPAPQAPAVATTAQAPIPDQPLVIPMPSGATVQVEVELHDDDLLGVFKSLLRGVGQAANAVTPAMTTPAAPAGATKTVSDAQMAAILSNADLSDVFKDVTHIHFILLTVPGGDDPAPAAPGKAHPPVPPTYPDQTSFYETAFATEGGHRIIFSNFDPVHIVMTSFGHAHGFAFMVQAPGSIAIFRADGYPDLSKLSALAASIGAAVGKSALTDVKVAPVSPVKTVK
jgi:hypothetical protein